MQLSIAIMNVSEDPRQPERVIHFANFASKVRFALGICLLIHPLINGGPDPVVVLAMHYNFSDLKGSEITQSKLDKLAPKSASAIAHEILTCAGVLTVYGVCLQPRESL